MSVFVRLWEKVLGIPHRHENAARVAAASEELSSTVRALTAQLKPYVESEDPLAAFMRDAMRNRRLAANKMTAKFRP